VIRGRKQGRPWPGYGPKSYRKKKKTTWEMKEYTILASCRATVNYWDCSQGLNSELLECESDALLRPLQC
jgi:hypothetical protein